MKLKILVILTQFVYPLVFISPALFSSTGTYIAVPNSNGGSDVLGLVRMAQVMQFMEGINFHSIWTAFPVGENLWPIQSLTQLFPNILLGILAQFFDAFDAVNLLIVIAWTFTGTAGVFLLRVLGTNYSTAIIGGLFIQLQPSMQFASVSVTSLLFLGFPLLICAIMLKTVNLSDTRQLNLAIIVLMISAFTDGYVYYFGFICFSIMLFFVALRRDNKSKRDFQIFMLRLVVAALPIIGAYFVSSFRSTGQGLRSLSPPSMDILNINGLEPYDYLVPHMESIRVGLSCSLLCQEPAFRNSVSGFGLIVVFAVVGAFIWLTIKRMWTRELRYLSILALIAFLLSLRMTFNLFGLTLFNPTYVFVPLFPGALYLDRFGVLASTLFVALIIAVSAKIIATNVSRKLIIPVAAVLLAANLLDQNPFGTRELSMEYKSYEAINKAIKLDSGTAVLFTPYTFHGRRWLQQAYIALPMKNSLFNPSLGALPETAAYSEASRIACSLHYDGITHLISESGSNLSALNPYSKVSLDPSHFQLRISAEVPAYEYGTTTLDVYEIVCTEPDA